MFNIDLTYSPTHLTKKEGDREHMSGRVRESKCRELKLKLIFGAYIIELCAELAVSDQSPCEW